MVRNITAEETTAGTEISWEPPDEISDIKEKVTKRGRPVFGLASRFAPKILSFYVNPSKVVCLVQPGQDRWRSD